MSPCGYQERLSIDFVRFTNRLFVMLFKIHLRLRTKLAKVNEENRSEEQQLANDFDGYIETGFQLATLQGPLCAEPVDGLAYFIESLEIDEEGLEEERGQSVYEFVFLTNYCSSSTPQYKTGWRKSLDPLLQRSETRVGMDSWIGHHD